MQKRRNESFGGAVGCAGCAELLAAKFDRRRFLIASASGIAAAALTPSFALAKYGRYEAMMLSCIDPRFQSPVFKYMAGRKLSGQYSHFVVAGAAIGVVAPAFKDWHKTFWDNLAASIELHSIAKVIVIDHRDCGAAKIAYGDAAVATPEAETTTHRDALGEFRKQLKERFPNLGAETGLMSLNGKLEKLG